MALKQFSVYLRDLHVIYTLDTKYSFNFKYLNDPKLIIVHSTGKVPLTIEEYYTKSVEAIGQPKTHFIIDRKGAIYQTLPINTMGNHVPRHNEHSLGISLHNIISSRSVTQALKYSFMKLTSILKDEFNIACVKTHKELAVEDVERLIVEVGYMSNECMSKDSIDVQKFLLLNGKQLEKYKEQTIERIEDKLEQSLYRTMLIDRIKKIPDCPGKHYDRIKFESFI